jgi:NAD(P)-dependent dehydrogenase (short-subunit alcohol dehydrogenase family)
VAADTVDEIETLMADVWDKLESRIVDEYNFDSITFDRTLVCSVAPALRMLYRTTGSRVGATAVFCTNNQVNQFVTNISTFTSLMKPFTPDHMVYYKDEPLFVQFDADMGRAFSEYEEKKGYKPKIVAVEALGFFALGNSKKEAEQARLLFLDAIKIAVYTQSFGGVLPMTDEFIAFISNWEVESYRSSVAMTSKAGGRLQGRIALITGAAQGFGKGLAEAMADEGAYLIVADVNKDGATNTANEINGVYDQVRAMAVAADVTNEQSVEHMIQEAVLSYGGLDILIANAGVLVAGALGDMTVDNFDFVTNVNYKGYFLCAKYAAIPMMIQHEFAPDYLTDIIEINSKSGLEGSNKNFAYAGSKFGGIGLTQSFALELVEYGIKVNAVCPGNLLDGPLWSDPEKGLFRQYLDSGKVPGAETIADVRKFYEDKVPMKRGCTIEDVARAIYYIVEQEYETGQAIPVTGGQVMMR